MPRSLKTILACVFLVSFLAVRLRRRPGAGHYLLVYRLQRIPPRCIGFHPYLRRLGGRPRGSRSVSWYRGHSVVWYFGRIPSGRRARHYWRSLRTTPTFTIHGRRSGADPRSLARGDGYQLNWMDTNWTYKQTAVVPLPPSVFLLGSGLLGFAGWRRFRKN